MAGQGKKDCQICSWYVNWKWPKVEWFCFGRSRNNPKFVHFLKITLFIMLWIAKFSELCSKIYVSGDLSQFRGLIWLFAITRPHLGVMALLWFRLLAYIAKFGKIVFWHHSGPADQIECLRCLNSLEFHAWHPKMLKAVCLFPNQMKDKRRRRRRREDGAVSQCVARVREENRQG